MDTKLTKEDVWGEFSSDYSTLIRRGMIVAQGLPTMSAEEKAKTQKKIQVPDICPVWKDKLPYKSVTVICDESQADEVIHWLSYVHGGEYSQRRNLTGGKVAFRSDYQAW